MGITGRTRVQPSFTGMLSGMAMGPYRGKETGETALFRELFDRLAEAMMIIGVFAPTGDGRP